MRAGLCICCLNAIKSGFLASSRRICCGYSIELSHLDAFNDYHNKCVISNKIRITISNCKFGNFCEGFMFTKLRICEVS